MEISFFSIAIALFMYFLPFILLLTWGIGQFIGAIAILCLSFFIATTYSEDLPILLVSLSASLFTINGQMGAILSGIPISLSQYADFRSIILSEKNFSGNFFLQILNPILFASIACAYFENILSADSCVLFWIIVPIYWSMRLVFLFVKNYRTLLNLRYIVVPGILANLFSYAVFDFVIQPLIYSTDTIFITQTALRDALWYGIIAYIFAFACKVYQSYMPAKSIAPTDKWQKFILQRKQIFSARYGKVIQTLIDKNYPANESNKESEPDGKKEFIALLYAIMIYEDFNRPSYLRCIENILARLPAPFHREYTLGIMQMRSDKPLTDEESISCAIMHFLPMYLEALYPPNNSSSAQKNSAATFSQALSSKSSLKQYTHSIPREFSGFHSFHSRRMVPSPRRIASRKKPQSTLNISINISPSPNAYSSKTKNASLSPLTIDSTIRKVLNAYNGFLYQNTVYQIYQEIKKTDTP